MPTSEKFITERKRAWKRLEELLVRLDRSSLRRLHREEVRELGDIYRRAGCGPRDCPRRIARSAVDQLPQQLGDSRARTHLPRGFVGRQARA
ncbi:MAG: hypothetical protein WKF84_11740 [Pyrinomonadaceae bacterium]